MMEVIGGGAMLQNGALSMLEKMYADVQFPLVLLRSLPARERSGSWSDCPEDCGHLVPLGV